MTLLIRRKIFHLSSYDRNDGILGKNVPDALSNYSFLSRHGQTWERGK